MGVLWRRTKRKEANPDGTMGLIDHLRELRGRLFKASLAIAIGLIIGYLVADPVFEFLSSPYCGRYAEECKFTAQSPIDPFLLKLRVALYVGIILAAPVWLYQLWAFVAPALHRKEKRWAYLFAAVGFPLFLSGAFLAHFVIDKGLAFLLSTSGEYSIDVNINGYFDFVTGMLLVFGLAFEFPLLIFILNLAGVVTGRRLLSWWRISVFLIFVFTAFVTPTPDPFGMTALAIPICLLYFVACGAAMLVDRRRAKAEQLQRSKEPSDDEASQL